MNKISIGAAALTMLVLVGCQNEAAREPIPIVLKAEKGDAITLRIPRGYIEEPKDPEGVLTHVILRTPSKDFEGSEVFAPESEIRILIEPMSSAVDAAEERLAAALRRPRPSEDAIVKSDEQSKPGLDVYAFRNGKEDAEAYYFTSASGDVFVECWKAVCKAFKTWDKRVHLRFDYQPVKGSRIQEVDESVDRMLQTFAAEANPSR